MDRDRIGMAIDVRGFWLIPKAFKTVFVMSMDLHNQDEWSMEDRLEYLSAMMIVITCGMSLSILLGYSLHHAREHYVTTIHRPTASICE